MLNQPTLGFFNAQKQAFDNTLSDFKHTDKLLSAVLSQAFSSFDGNLQNETADYPPVACHKGCAACCTLRVTATAPEIFLIAGFIAAATVQNNGGNLRKRLIKTNKHTCGLNEDQRLKMQCPCPFVVRGVCMIYPVRPLACRGHACYDKKACHAAVAGCATELPVSQPHLYLRSIIQNAMQSALRDAGLAWGNYELIQAVSIALSHQGLQQNWLDGEDVFAIARVTDISAGEMADTFELIKVMS